MTLEERMYINLYKRPVAIMCFAFLLTLITTYGIPWYLDDSKYLSVISDSSKNISPYIALLGSGVSGLLFLYSGYTHYKWYRGKGEFCHTCGAMVEEKYGRYGFYFKCLGCGKTRRIE